MSSARNCATYMAGTPCTSGPVACQSPSPANAGSTTIGTGAGVGSPGGWVVVVVVGSAAVVLGACAPGGAVVVVAVVAVVAVVPPTVTGTLLRLFGRPPLAGAVA